MGKGSSKGANSRKMPLFKRESCSFYSEWLFSDIRLIPPFPLSAMIRGTPCVILEEKNGQLTYLYLQCFWMCIANDTEWEYWETRTGKMWGRALSKRRSKFESIGTVKRRQEHTSRVYGEGSGWCAGLGELKTFPDTKHMDDEIKSNNSSG